MEYKPLEGILDFKQDWSKWLAVGDSISTSAWDIAPAGLSIDGESLDGSAVTVIVSGGVLGETYRIRNTITTANGLKTSRDWFLKIQEKAV